MSYDPAEFRALQFHGATAGFVAGHDTPRAYLERCLEAIAAREPVVKAWAALNEAGAREHLSITRGAPVLLKSGHFPPGAVSS